MKTMQRTMSCKPVTEFMREASTAMRVIAGLVLVTFTMLILEPAAMAAQAAPAPSQKPAHTQSDEEKLSEVMQRLDTKLAGMDDKLGKGQDTAGDQAELVTMKNEVNQLDQAVIANFQAIEDHIVSRQLPDVILQRHKDAVAKYQRELGTLRGNLDAIDQAATPEERRLKVQQAKAHLKSAQHQRSQQPFDPNDLPNRSLKPNPDNKPKTDKKAFTQAGLHDNPTVKLAALGDFTFDKLPGASDPAYLAATPEVTLSQAIKDQAQSLNYDPVTIYHWVRNNIEWQPAWGAMQNADLTLSAKRGNAMDIASLTIALLRASQIPARYVHGTIDVPADQFKNWAGGFSDINAAMQFAASGGIPITPVVGGGQVTKVRIEHLWVEAAIDYQPSRGAKNRDADSWVQMDPSFKQYEYLTGLDAVAISGLDPNALAQDFVNSGTVNETEGWEMGLDSTVVESAQTQAKTALEDYISSNLSSQTAKDAIGGRKTIVKEFPVLPSALPNHIVVAGVRYSALPNLLQHHMSFAFGKDILGDLIDPTTYPYAQLNNQKVTLSFKPATADDEAALLSLLPVDPITDLSQWPASIPAYLIHVIPELAVNGQVVKQSSAMSLGGELSFNFGVSLVGYGTRPYEYKVPAGAFLNIAVIGGNVSPQIHTEVQTKISRTKAILAIKDVGVINALTREDILGDLFYAGTLGYYTQYNALSNLIGLQQKAHHYLAAGYGSFGYEPHVDYFFGTPRAITTGGAVMNIPLLRVIGTDTIEHQSYLNYSLQTGVLSSALEHAVPEQLFNAGRTNPPDAISAVKALSKANALGQRIYHITSANKATALPNIHHDVIVMNEIQNALAIGKEVITHTDTVGVPGWSGAGYIILDPQTGDGAYKIGGGQNGSLTTPNGAEGMSAAAISESHATGFSDFVEINPLGCLGEGDQVGILGKVAITIAFILVIGLSVATAGLDAPAIAAIFGLITVSSSATAAGGPCDDNCKIYSIRTHERWPDSVPLGCVWCNYQCKNTVPPNTFIHRYNKVEEGCPSPIPWVPGSIDSTYCAR